MRNQSSNNVFSVVKRCPTLLLIGVILLGAVDNTLVFAHDVTVNITGNVTNGTCSLSPSSLNKTVNMGSYRFKDFLNKGDSSPPVEFNIDLDNCGVSANGVQVSFSGTPDAFIADDFKIAPESTGSGIAVEILDDAQKNIPVGGTSKVYGIEEGAQRKSLLFYARMVANGDKVVAGNIIAAATFKTEYP